MGYDRLDLVDLLAVDVDADDLCPISARQAEVTAPTYPSPMTVTSMLQKSDAEKLRASS